MLCFRLQHIYFVALYVLFFPDSKSRNEEIMAFDGVTIARSEERRVGKECEQ